jgi:hypothetical protein
MTGFRNASIGDYWRHAYERNYSDEVVSLEFVGGGVFSGVDVGVLRGVCAIVGKNGLGKSNLIRGLYNIFCGNGGNRPALEAPLIADSNFQLKIKVQGDVHELSILKGGSFQELGSIPGISTYLYDPCIFMPVLKEFLQNQENFEEELEAFEAVELGAQDLALINYIANASYTSVSMTVIEGEYPELGDFPFFKVSTNFANYDSRGMGLGEISIFYFFWIFYSLRLIKGPRFLFVEEPESFLPPSVQTRMSGLLAYLAGELGVMCMISSHSEHIIKKIPRSNILVMRRYSGALRIDAAGNNYEALNVLGLESPKVGVLFYEDSFAGTLLRALLQASKVYVPDAFYYHKSGSDGEVKADINRFPKDIAGFKGVGVFDGDCRSNRAIASLGVSKCFLPSDESPDVLVRRFVLDLPGQELASLFGRSEIEVSSALAGAEGLDPHDFFFLVAKTLGMELPYLINVLCEHWVAHPGNAALVAEFIEDFRSRFGPA